MLPKYRVQKLQGKKSQNYFQSCFWIKPLYDGRRQDYILSSVIDRVLCFGESVIKNANNNGRGKFLSRNSGSKQLSYKKLS